MHDTIFENIIKDENSLTEAFRNFLRFPAFRNLFLDLIDWGILNEHEVVFEDFETQISIDEYGKPDMRLLTSEIELLIEVKVDNANTTPNQPNGYLNYLNVKSTREHKGLVFLVPKDYYYLGSYEKEQNEWLKSNSVPDIFTNTIFWFQIIDEIENQNLPEFSTLFKEFNNLLTLWFKPEIINFTHQNISIMFSKEIPQTITKLLEFVDSVETEIKKKYKIKQGRPRNFSEYGFYIKNEDEENFLFFGVWGEFWEKHEKPLLLCLDYDFSNDKNLTALFIDCCNENRMHYINYDDQYPSTYFEKEFLMDSGNTKSIVKIIEKYILKLQPEFED